MKEMLVSIQHSAPCISPFEGITSPFPPLKGGLEGDVHRRSVYCHSERSEESPFFSGARFLTAFGMTKAASKSIFTSGLQPSQRGYCFFPNAPHWAELTRPFRAFTAIS